MRDQKRVIAYCRRWPGDNSPPLEEQEASLRAWAKEDGLTIYDLWSDGVCEIRGNFVPELGGIGRILDKEHSVDAILVPSRATLGEHAKAIIENEMKILVVGENESQRKRKGPKKSSR